MATVEKKPETMTTEEATIEELKKQLAAKEAEIAKATKEAAKQAKASEAALKAKEAELRQYAEQAEKAKEEEAASNSITRRVKIRLPRHPGVGDEAVTVRVNNYTAIIRRGVDVEVPYYVALSLKESMAADDRTSMMVQELENGYSRI